MAKRIIKAVAFDIGGVVATSPLIAIAEYETQNGISDNYINNSIVRRGSEGAWQQFERGELALFPFYVAFGRELSDTANGNVWYAEYCQKRGLECPQLPRALRIDGRELFGRMMRKSQELDIHILEAIRRIRAAGRWRLIAITNNFSTIDASQLGFDDSFVDKYPDARLDTELEFLGWTDGAVPQYLRGLFDDFVDSSEVGMRKPEIGFYMLACTRNDVRPEEVVFLDDLRLNLKAARSIGMETIHVPIGGSLAALKQLEEVLGIDLTGDVDPGERTPSKL
ncbi:HAD-like protein [Auriscalpium vulgare]|uniref:HAD-like protein n=1 Tax=Auriscalpium vulgare TaxID=40419 RepID=A0ACB8SD69_9AGAM|nr:HAD-like protein [Auriscalpium vulgare]